MLPSIWARQSGHDGFQKPVWYNNWCVQHGCWVAGWVAGDGMVILDGLKWIGLWVIPSNSRSINSTSRYQTDLVGGLNPSEKYESQLGWLFPIYGKIKNVPSHQPGTKQMIITESSPLREPRMSTCFVQLASVKSTCFGSSSGAATAIGAGAWWDGVTDGIQNHQWIFDMISIQ